MTMRTVKVDAERARLARLTTKELKLCYEEVCGEACRSNNRVWLTKRILWRLQANAEGDLSERARRRAHELADDRDLRLKAPQQKGASSPPTTNISQLDRDPRLPAVGTVITRTYKGVEHFVTVEAETFLWEGERYKSLSAVAKAITGTHTNGFAFFKLPAAKTGKGGAR